MPSTVSMLSANLTLLLLVQCLILDLLIRSESIAEKEAMLLRELNGKNLRFPAYPDHPWLKQHEGPNGTLTYTGFIKSIADSMAEVLNITYTFVPVPKAEVNQLGLSEASINMLMRNEIDVVTKILNLDNYSKMDCSLPLFLEGHKLIVPWPDQETSILSPIRPFDYKVWILMLISIIALSLTLTWLPKLYRFRGENFTTNQEFSSRFASALNYVLFGQGDWSRWKRISFRIMQGCWCLAAFVLVNAYSTTLVSNLTAPKLMPVARSYEDLVAPNPPQYLKLITEKNEIAAKYAMVVKKLDILLTINVKLCNSNSLKEIITLKPRLNRSLTEVCYAQQKQAKTGFWKALGDIWRENPYLLFTDRQKAFEMLFTSRQHANVGTDGRVADFMNTAFKRGKGNCKLTVSSNYIARQYPFIWTYPKHWRYTDAVNHKLKWWPESGLMQYWKYDNQIMRGIDECRLPVDRSISSKNGDDRKVLTLDHLSGPFLFLIFGISVSFLVFLLETIYYNYMKRRTAP